MKYDFKTLINRHHSGAVKYEIMKARNPNIGENIVPYSVADMEFKTPPEIVEALKKYLDEQNLGYIKETSGYLEVVNAWMRTRHDWEIKNEWIVCTPGVVSALYSAVTAFTEPEDGIILMTPIYHDFYYAVEAGKRAVVKNPLLNENGRYEIDYDDLERKAREPRNKLLIFCSPHNPVGRVWTKEELTKVGEICIRNNILIISDEIHFDLVMPGYTHTVFAKVEGVADRTIICTAPSKTFNLAGMQTSNIIIPDARLRRIFKKQLDAAGMMNLNTLGYRACEAAYRECGAWLDELIEVIVHNHRTLKTYMEKNHPEIIVYPLEGTYLQWMDFRALGLNRKELEETLEKDAEVFLDHGHTFGDEGEGFERMNLACPSVIMMEGLERLSKGIQKLKSEDRFK